MSYQLHVFYDDGAEATYTDQETIEDAEDLASVVQTYPHVVDIILEKEYE